MEKTVYYQSAMALEAVRSRLPGFFLVLHVARITAVERNWDITIRRRMCVSIVAVILVL